tara:strand:+ start:391 stop:993 length:603 start_codon:yes stop_codon:yes gene_type:complete
MKRKDIFAIPFFELKVDLDKVVIPESEFRPSWESGIFTTSQTQKQIPRSTLEYLTGIISEPLNTLRDKFEMMRFENVWRNKYEKHTYQGYHIHPKTQWSFVIYETVQSAKTVFMNPSAELIQNHSPIVGSSYDSPLTYDPIHLGPGDMVLFPSWLAHHVVPGNTGTTISGNVLLHHGNSKFSQSYVREDHVTSKTTGDII